MTAKLEQQTIKLGRRFKSCPRHHTFVSKIKYLRPWSFPLKLLISTDSNCQ